MASLSATGCKSSGSSAPSSSDAPAQVTPEQAGAAPGQSGTSSAAAPDPEEPSDWVPAEHKRGMSRWKDSGVYVDGKLVGVLTFEELPLGLEPVFREEEANVEFGPGDKDRVGTDKQRYYRVLDYLTATGVDVQAIKELHVQGPHKSEVLVVGGAELRERGKDFYFRFGGEVSGKPIPAPPPNFGNRLCGDKLAAMSVYIDKPPPKLVHNIGLELDGEIVDGIPYFGEPLRGGVRIYKDNRFAAVIKRHKLQGEGEQAREIALFGFLEQQGVSTSDVVQAWVVRDGEHAAQLGRAELEKASFAASSRARGEVQLGHGDDRARVQVLKLFTKPMSKDALPVLMPWE